MHNVRCCYCRVGNFGTQKCPVTDRNMKYHEGHYVLVSAAQRQKKLPKLVYRQANHGFENNYRTKGLNYRNLPNRGAGRDSKVKSDQMG